MSATPAQLYILDAQCLSKSGSPPSDYPTPHTIYTTFYLIYYLSTIYSTFYYYSTPRPGLHIYSSSPGDYYYPAAAPASRTQGLLLLLSPSARRPADPPNHHWHLDQHQYIKLRLSTFALHPSTSATHYSISFSIPIQFQNAINLKPTQHRPPLPHRARAPQPRPTRPRPRSHPGAAERLLRRRRARLGRGRLWPRVQRWRRAAWLRLT